MSETRIHGYARVSSKEQNEARQLNELKEFGIADRDIYVDKQRRNLAFTLQFLIFYHIFAIER